MTVFQINVISSMISSAHWDDEIQELTVTFNNGGSYKYFDVPRSVFEEMRTQTENVGKWFTANIKNKYRYEKV